MVPASTNFCLAAFHFSVESYVMKQRRKRIDKGKEARRAARKSGLAPAVTRVIPDKRKRPAKHKKQLQEAELE